MNNYKKINSSSCPEKLINDLIQQCNNCDSEGEVNKVNELRRNGVI